MLLRGCEESSLEPAVIFQSFLNIIFLSVRFHFAMIDIWIPRLVCRKDVRDVWKRAKLSQTSQLGPS
ncbi:unnamed protein product [Rangifer tarandus platyrhynchus]|uniref:Uncharacterized protein n=1 Tax=Rangifer tarandus platyrhynchus TaxID=3082113 RepID=A0AC59YCB5_RANTA